MASLKSLLGGDSCEEPVKETKLLHLIHNFKLKLLTYLEVVETINLS